MKLKQVGEFDLIEMMADVFRRDQPDRPGGGAGSPQSFLGIGDDAAVWRTQGDQLTIATTDAMIEGVHFTRETTDWYDLGWKAMASNISDIAGMGAVPKYALAVLGAPGDLEVEDALRLCQGMADVAARYGAVVVGGDTVASPVTMISIALVGAAPSCDGSGLESRLLTRSAAKPGDLLAVTGRLGASAAGLELLLGREASDDGHLAPLVESHRRPNPRVKEGQLLVEAGVRCGMDLSDGLAGDLLRICRASHVAAVVQTDALPVSPLLRDEFGERATEMALSGGEDYELLCAAPPAVIDRAREMLQAIGTPLTVVGSVAAPREGQPPLLLADSEGRLQPPSRSGWEHFTAGPDAARA